MLSAEETDAAQALLTAAWGASVTVRSAEAIWNRSHIVRLALSDGRSAVLKRDRDADSSHPDLSFAAERAALAFLNGMSAAIAPRLFGADDRILVMEDLGPAVSLARSLLGRDAGRAEADLLA